MNSIGRFFGIGWSNGYHSGTYDGRYQVVKARHPAHNYGSNALQHPYHPGYEPQRPYAQSTQNYPQPIFSNTGEFQSGSIPAGVSSQASPTPAPAVPPKPVEPPPTWLRQFLKDEDKGAPKAADQRSGQKETRKAEDPEASPSDLPEPKKAIEQGEQKPSDDDDLLTLAPPLNGQ
jgi:hypothetical protein